MNTLTSFKAVYCSGCFISDPALIPAMALLFEKVYLPRNIEIVKEFAKRYRIRTSDEKTYSDEVHIQGQDEASTIDPFADLSSEERETACRYIAFAHRVIYPNSRLFPDIFETELFPNGSPLKVELIRKGKPGSKNLYRVGPQSMTMVGDDEETFPRLLKEGYVPVITQVRPSSQIAKGLDRASAKQLAGILGMASVSMFFPGTRAAHPEVILEARERLKDHLPPFWSTMLKLTTALEKQIAESATPSQLVLEAKDIVDTTVRPAVIDLIDKMEKERRNFFYRMLSSVQRGLRLMVGNPPMTQQQLLTNALVIGSDVAMTAAGQMRAIEALKEQSGLTYLIKLQEMTKEAQSPNKRSQRTLGPRRAKRR